MQLKATHPGKLSLASVLPDSQWFGGRDIRFDSCTTEISSCRPGDLFVATVNGDEDLHEAADAAVRQGAAAIVAERLLPVSVPVCVVDNSTAAYGRICQQLSGNPADALRVVGVTGTNGKTTVSFLIASILRAARQQSASSTTLGRFDGLERQRAGRTTPNAAELADWLTRSLTHGCDNAVIELSSRALAEHRTAGVNFDTAVFTNLRRDHIDAHGSVWNYRRAKERLLSQLKPHGFVVLNADDPGCQALLPKVATPVITFGLREEAEVTATLVERFASEQTFLIHAGNESVPVRTTIIGDQHLANCLAAAAVGLVCGIDLLTIAQGLERLSSLPNRMQRVECGRDFQVFLDCGDTPDRLATSLKTLRQVTSGRLLCAWACEANASPADRAMLGRVLERGCDKPVLSAAAGSDAAHDTLDGFSRPAMAHVIPSRPLAVRWILEHARPGDSVLLAGGPRQLIDQRAVSEETLVRHFLQSATAATSSVCRAVS